MGLIPIIKLINQIFYIYSMLLVVYALMSWFPNARNSGLGQIVSKLVRPYLDVFDRLIPPIGGISINVIVAILVLEFIQRGLITVLLRLFG